MPVFVIILGGLFVIGLINLLTEFVRIKDEQKFVSDFLDKFNAYVKNKDDDDLYQWLLKRVDRIQSMLESAGIGVYSYKPPFANYIIQHYRLLVETLEKIPQRQAHGDDIQGSKSVLIRFSGILDNQITELKKRLINPISWLSAGVSWLVTLPVSMLYSLGILGISEVRNFKTKPIVKLISGALSLIAFVGAVVSLIVDWNQFVILLKGFIFRQ